MGLSNAKVPAVIATGLICFLLGGGLGAVAIMYTQSEAKPTGGAPPDEDAKANMKAPDAKGGKGFGGNKGGGGPKGFGGNKGGGGGGGGRGFGPKVQLAILVARLDTLTGQTLHIDLMPEQKKQAQELLAGLAEKDALTDEEAQEKLDALLKLLDTHKKTLEDTGFRLPGAGGGGGPGGMPPANPFKEGEGAAHLKSLQATLGK